MFPRIRSTISDISGVNSIVFMGPSGGMELR